MIALPTNVAMFLYTAPTDMRKSFDGLSGLVRSELNGEPTDGSLFLFVNRRRDRMKILHWQEGGFVLWYKRLESGTFESIRNSDGKSAVTIDATELAMLISGIPLQSAQRRRRRAAPAGGGVVSRDKNVAV